MAMADVPTRLSPDLPDEIVHEILFRLPPDDPAGLVRLSLLSKPWRLLLADPSFHRRYRQFHRKPPMRGFFHTLYGRGMMASGFVPTTSSCPQPIPDRSPAHYGVCDSRHGRVLLDDGAAPLRLVVWDPMTGLQTTLSPSDHVDRSIYVGTAVLCAVDGCDHAACHDGPFRVVFVGVRSHEKAIAIVYSSETGEWGTPTSELQLVEDCYLDMWPSVLVGDGLHFLLTKHGSRILKYHLDTHHLSLIEMPPGMAGCKRGPILMAAENGRLGIAHLDKKELELCLWSRESALDGAAAWTRRRVIDLKPFLPAKRKRNPAIKLELVGSPEGADVIFATMALGVYVLDLKLLQLQPKKVCEIEPGYFRELYPFTGFCIPPPPGSSVFFFLTETALY
jgi:hypothetical protein